ncbi:hypothetical protein KOM00_17085 [Geomonas sp. Red69]|uniref:Uncharacterized protein n=1 Tax=Geomonas diazotrophica TaxID=2843197 RepID=A0ABX8JPK0_9BACT|nr:MULTISPECIES: hypothetical protein [Geomonas]MBU5638443.1 hypothetical protein [Geomonas diazotrophica]QWV97350.1 hypothetical protein KP005_18725 [Geomonas nitrogeniifigens]QXE86508.1 hypothetical protein KP003_19465 [Geomonas nitrogeniifigens]
MACELVECCQFFKDNMKDLPKAAQYIQSKLCFGDYQSCNRYQIYRQTGEHLPFELFPDDQEAIKKVKQCMRKKQCQNGPPTGQGPDTE